MPVNNGFAERANFIFSIADLIRDVFKRGKYQDVILPLTVLRRMDCVLQPTKQDVLATHQRLKGKIEYLEPQLRRASGHVFYNLSPFTFERLLDDPHNIKANLTAYINGFSQNMREVIERFDFRNTIDKLDEAGLLYLVIQRFCGVDLHPETVDNHQMGTIFEELIRRFNEALDENPGEHFTPREIIHLMADLLILPENGKLQDPQRVVRVSDPACGTGGMLTIAKDRLLQRNPLLNVIIYGQEVNPETFAVCKADLYMKTEKDGRDAETIAFGSTLSHDAFPDIQFDFQLANPPYGKEWKGDKANVTREAAIPSGRFSAGLPRISDGQLLFLQHMIFHMLPPEKGGGRISIVLNGSPLFTGDAGSGESEIRRWILENDWLEAIIALPENIFYNTGISTYIWVLSNHKKPERQGKVQLINAADIWTPLRKSLGDKRREISQEQIHQIYMLYANYEETGNSKIFPVTEFGYRKITVERPLRLSFEVSPQRLARLMEQPEFAGLNQTANQPTLDVIPDGSIHQQEILDLLAGLEGQVFTSRVAFESALDAACRLKKVKLESPVRKAVLSALGERDETAEICRDKNGNPEPDPELRDTENVPLNEDVEAWFAREVTPYAPDAWINTTVRDMRDGGVGKVGYEINFNRHFFVYQPPRPLEEIEAEILSLQDEISQLLNQLGI